MNDPGQVKIPVTFREKVLVEDGGGGGAPLWSDVLATSCHVAWLGTRETVRAGQPLSVTLATVVIRWRPDCPVRKGHYAFLPNGVALRIEGPGIDPEYRHRFLHYPCTQEII